MPTTTELIQLIETLGGPALSASAEKVLSEYLPEIPEEQLGPLLASLNACIGIASSTGISLPVSQYSEEFFNQAVSTLGEGATAAGFESGVLRGETYPILGIYWQIEPGNDQTTIYIIRIQEAEPEPPGLSHDSLSALFTDIADAIRSASGSSEPIIADQFPASIRAIECGREKANIDLGGGLQSTMYLVIDGKVVKSNGSNQLTGVIQVDVESLIYIEDMTDQTFYGLVVSGGVEKMSGINYDHMHAVLYKVYGDGELKPTQSSGGAG